MVFWVLECRGVGGVGVEAGDNLVAGEFAGCRIMPVVSLDEDGKRRDKKRTHQGKQNCL